MELIDDKLDLARRGYASHRGQTIEIRLHVGPKL